MDWENAPTDEELENGDYFGFVYLIERTNAVEGERKYYIGKKLFFTDKKMPPLKGKKRNRRVRKQTDWKKYYGSSNELKEDIKKYGKNVFRRTILEYGSCKWELAWLELKHQIQNEVLFRNDFYNNIIHVRLNGAPRDLKEKYNSTK